jgi:hypothetical protein
MRVTMFMLLTTVSLISMIDADAVRADTYCNGSDPTLQANCLTGSGTVLHYDDFEDGQVACTFGDKSDPLNDGWSGGVYAPGCAGNGCSNGTPYTVIGESNCWGRPGGAGGTGFAAYTGQRPGSREGQTPFQGDHNFNQDVTEFYGRFFIKFTPFHQFGGNEKLSVTINPRMGSSAGMGILFGNIHGDGGSGTPQCAPMYNYIPGYGNIQQNQGNNIQICPNNHWYFVEYHVKLGSGNGVWEEWINDCGTRGLVSDCGPSPILRARYTNLTYKSGIMGNWWFEFYHSGTGPRPGEGYFDEVLAMKTGPIGFSGLSGNVSSDLAPPDAPTGLQIN